MKAPSKAEWIYAAIAILVLAFTAFGQDAKPPEKQAEAKAEVKAEAKAPELKKETQLKLRSLQFEQAQLTIEMQSVIARYKELIAESQRKAEELQLAVDEAFKEAGTDKEKYVIDLKSMTFVPAPKMVHADGSSAQKHKQ